MNTSCVGQRKGKGWVPFGCQTRCRFSGRICRTPLGMGTYRLGRGRGESPDRGFGWSQRGLVPRGKATTTQCTGRHRIDPAPGRKPRIDLPCLLVLLVYYSKRCVHADTFWCRWTLGLVSYSPLPLPISPRRPLWSYTGIPQNPR